ncbi:hypothetical protein EMPS_08733 [Entomortierella parvispora]|uniref:Uncharacterized protein n=1 Tax=Entomortierella parvispora TaxID=205924 RepID=A0A9P3LZK3_9FUNG|nr:hypothetical protein EMPS_08733 [Entomortierella parvispora]
MFCSLWKFYSIRDLRDAVSPCEHESICSLLTCEHLLRICFANRHHSLVAPPNEHQHHRSGSTPSTCIASRSHVRI